MEFTDRDFKKALNDVIDTDLAYFWEKHSVPDVNPYEVVMIYKRAFDAQKIGDSGVSERWSRMAKHLTQALQHEARIAYLEPQTAELAFLKTTDNEEKETLETAMALLDSLAEELPPEVFMRRDELARYLARGRRHLQTLREAESPGSTLLRLERIRAAQEYGRVVESLKLADAAEARQAQKKLAS